MMLDAQKMPSRLKGTTLLTSKWTSKPKISKLPKLLHISSSLIPKSELSRPTELLET